MTSTDAQVRKLMEEMCKSGKKGVAAARAGMDPKTARKYLEEGKLPSELKKPRTWRTRQDPLESCWADAMESLRAQPELEPKTLLESFVESEKYEGLTMAQLRTFQRRVRMWKAQEGPPKEVFFPQNHRPGEAMQTDFTSGAELGVTIRGEPFPHLLCHPVLPFSNWEWVTVCRSESLAALRRGVQEALFRLGRVPKYHQTDNSTAATHDLPGSGKRDFNEEYLAVMRHLGMEPRTIAVGEKEQNGDVESAHAQLKRRIKQRLLLRGNSDFESVEEYESWIQAIAEKANRSRCEKVKDELTAMRSLVVDRLPEYREEDVLVTTWSTIRVKYNTYSVPARLIRERVCVHVYEDKIAVYFAGRLEMQAERLLGRNQHRINYRHIIWWLVRKPGAFRCYRYREELFPTVAFRRAYDALRASLSERQADLEYLRTLHLAAATMESEVEAALEALEKSGQTPRFESVRKMVAPATPEVPEVMTEEVDLASYDELLRDREVAS